MEKNNQKLEVKNHIIGYIDVLGSTELMKNNENVFLNTLSECIDEVYGLIESSKAYSWLVRRENESIVKFRIFSDNIIFYCDFDNLGTTLMIYLMHIVQRSFLKRGLIIRGAITIGSLFGNEKFVYGKGLVEAYTLENKATYPRIILSDSFKKHLYTIPKNFVEFIKSYKICTDNNQVSKVKQFVSWYSDFMVFVFSTKIQEQTKVIVNLEAWLIQLQSANYYEVNIMELDRSILSIISEIEKSKILESNDLNNFIFFFEKLISEDTDYSYINYLELVEDDNQNNLYFSNGSYYIAYKWGKISTLEEAILLARQNKPLELDLTEVRMREIEHHREVTVTGLEKNKGTESVYKKFNWMKEYHNDFCDTNGLIDKKI